MIGASMFSSCAIIYQRTTDDLKYAAMYFPRIYTGVDFNYKVAGDQTTDNDASVKLVNGPGGAQTLADLKTDKQFTILPGKKCHSNIPDAFTGFTCHYGYLCYS